MAHHHHHHLESGCGGGDASSSSQRKTLLLVFLLTITYFVVELAGGFLSNSLALLADAGHMFGDSFALGVALLASWASTKQAPSHYTFGYARLEILAALLNGCILLGVAVSIFTEGLGRFSHPEAVHVHMMGLIAVGGLIINIIAAWLLHRGQNDSLNMRAAYLHVISDLLGSVGAIAASILIFYTGKLWFDPVMSLIIAALVGRSSLHLIWDAINVLLETVPAHLSTEKIEVGLKEISDTVKDVHNLHIWHIDSKKIAVTAHVVVTEDGFSGETLNQLQSTLKQKFGLSHVTLQLETE